MKFIVITKKIWEKNNLKFLSGSFKLLKSLDNKIIKKINPKIVFFVYWSKMIPQNFLDKYLCIQFHSSDLPKFRGGTPIQHQILNNITKTKVSAFKPNNKIDEGDICLKKNITLIGPAKEIYPKIEAQVFKMITEITKKKKIKFVKQKGKGTYFKRRKPHDSKLIFDNLKNIYDIYNLIRCTDADDYPKAFIDFKNFKLEFSDAVIKNKREINAKIKISKKR